MMQDSLKLQAQSAAVSPAQDTSKKPYIRPEVIRYGDLKTLTQSNAFGALVDFEGFFS
mgnify:CR=1 FL=1